MELKRANSSLEEHVLGIWVKQAVSPLSETDPVRWKNPTYPYQIRAVEQVFPGKSFLEDFENRRSEIEERLNKGKVKLETIHGFYCPSSEESLRNILKEGFNGAFAGELTFCIDPLQAIRESLAQRPTKLVLARVTLGWKEYDYREINNKFKLKNLRGVLPSFVISIDQVQHGKDQEGERETHRTLDAYPEPIQTSESSYGHASYTSPPASYTSPPSRVPKYITDLGNDGTEGGITCPKCGRIAGPGSSGRFCVGCGDKIP